MDGFTTKVNETIDKLVQDESGNWNLPADVGADDALKFAVLAEKRRRDTQSAYTRSQQELAKLKLENEKLTEAWAEDFARSVEPSVLAELEELKVTDPEEWHKRLLSLEQEKTEKFNQSKAKVAGESEIQYRKRLVADWAEAHPELKLSDEVIADNVPPKFVKQLEQGDIEFSEFLSIAAKYLGKEKVLKVENEEAPGITNISKVSGSAVTNKNSSGPSLYEDAIF